jgi:hypothetical protein
MSIKLSVAAAAPSPSTTPVAEEEEFYSSWSLFLVCLLLILSLWTSYYLQIKKIRAVHETLVSMFAGMFVGLVIRLAPGTMIREMLVSAATTWRYPIRFGRLGSRPYMNRAVLSTLFLGLRETVTLAPGWSILLTSTQRGP